jgi:hypothetical protein
MTIYRETVATQLNAKQKFMDNTNYVSVTVFMKDLGIPTYTENGLTYIIYNGAKQYFAPFSCYKKGANSYMENGELYAGVAYLTNLIGWTLEWFNNTENDQTDILLQEGLTPHSNKTLKYFTDKSHTLTQTEKPIVNTYITVFEALPSYLKNNILQIVFWSGAAWLKKNITGDNKHHIAATCWLKTFGGKCPIFLDLEKPAKASGQLGYESVAAHEAGHALDTDQKKYSSSAEWQSITETYGAKIYSLDSKTAMEVFAAAMAWYVTNPTNLKSISLKAFSYIDNIVKGKMVK